MQTQINFSATILLHNIYHKLLICVIHVGNIPKGFLVLQHLPSRHLQTQVVFNVTQSCNQCMIWWGIDRGSYLHQFFNNRNVVKDFVQNFQNYKSMLFRKQWEWNHEIAQCSTVTHNCFNKFSWKSMGANRSKADNLVESNRSLRPIRADLISFTSISL